MEVQYIHVSILSLTPLGLWVNNNNILLLLGQCLFVYVCTQPPPPLLFGLYTYTVYVHGSQSASLSKPQFVSRPRRLETGGGSTMSKK